MWSPSTLPINYYSVWWRILGILALFWRISLTGQDGERSGEMVTALFSWGWFISVSRAVVGVKIFMVATLLFLYITLEWTLFPHGGLTPHKGEFTIGSYLKPKGSTKNVVRFLVLVRGNFFYIIWKLIYVALFWALTLNFWVSTSWPKMTLNPK